MIPYPPPHCLISYIVFDAFRQSLEDLINRATPPEERRLIVSRMRDTLVQAKAAANELRDALAKARQRLAAEERELETVRRRKQLAESIGDAETVQVASRFEQVHAERVEIVRRKIAAQEAELALADREVEQMSTELDAALAGSGSMNGAPGAGRGNLDASTEMDDAGVREQLDSLARARSRAGREADAERRLEELKRRMGK